MTATTAPTGIARLPRRLKGCVDTVDAALEGGPDVLLLSRQTSTDSLRQSLASLFFLASSLHTPQIPYYSKSLETSLARHVTVEQIWGQMSMLLRPVMRRLQENVRRSQKALNNSSAPLRDDATQGGVKRSRNNKVKIANGTENAEANSGHRDVLSTRTSELDESDMDDEIAQLLHEQQQQQQQRRRQRVKPRREGPDSADSWRYAFGKGNEGDDDEDEDEEDEEGVHSGDDDDDDAAAEGADDTRIRRRPTRAMLAAGSKRNVDNDEDDGVESDNEELEALKEMYGDDFVDDDDGGGDAYDEDDDPQLEEDLAWDDPSAAVDKLDGQYFGDDNILADPDTTGEQRPNEEEDDDEELSNPNLTELERERIRERRLVARLEQERLYSTQWAMTGEVGGKDRPRDALLDETLEFEHAMKAVPVITEAVTVKLEDRIRRRILDGNYDDVKRRTALSSPADLVSTTRRDAAAVAADSEKSRMSLMDLYEKDYLERMRVSEEATNGNTAEPLTEIEKDELRAIHMWRRLAQHLDALSNFHYTPKPVQEDFAARVRAVEGQVPAITVETVGNFATTREAALAPQDLYRGADRKYADVGANELVPRERRALRRAKKERGGAVRDRKEKRAAKAKEVKALRTT